ncbi:hypothetical protein KZC56_05825 [Microbacterium sp. SSW1-47]|uniref:hypothetical protein n=1 Tax=Microbacterium TaxID=33882 RepID=UPI00109BE7B3|nr:MULTISPECIES: hypothetical protein [Microbacterium]MBN6191348.1 hypothetical protein [Aneurinibacillus sp. BA2021]MCK2025811.1 hypothetical protein [Microbacterium sufflavum]MPS75979.1 hypothetical protein [Microbacterium sp.]
MLSDYNRSVLAEMTHAMQRLERGESSLVDAQSSLSARGPLFENDGSGIRDLARSMTARIEDIADLDGEDGRDSAIECFARFRREVE